MENQTRHPQGFLSLLQESLPIQDGSERRSYDIDYVEISDFFQGSNSCQS